MVIRLSEHEIRRLRVTEQTRIAYDDGSTTDTLAWF